MLRRLFVIALVCVLGLVPLTATAQEPEGQGSAATSANILDLRVEGLDVAGLSEGVSIGELLTFASTDTNAERNVRGDGNPFALAELVLAGQDTVTARSDGETRHEGRDANLSGLGTVSAGTVEALVENGEARSVINALSGNVDAVLGNISGKITEDSVKSVANADVARSGNGVIVSGLNLGLGDLLPADLLEQLPLPVLLDLAESLPLDASALSEVVGALEGVQAELPAVSDALDTELTGIVSDLDAALAPVDEALNGGGTLSVAELEGVIAEVEGIQATLDNLGAGLELEGLLSSLETLESLNLEQVVNDVVDAITGSQLLALDEVLVGAQTEASADDSNAEASCSVTGAQVLGEAAPAIDACDQLNELLTTIDTTLTSALGSLPVAGNVTEDLVRIGGLQTSTNEVVDGGYRVAQASVQGLTLDIGSLDLQDVTDGLVDDLVGQIEGLLGLLEGDLSILGGGDLSQLLDADLGSLLEGGLPGLIDGLQSLDTELEGVLSDGSLTGDDDVTEEVRDAIGNVTGAAGVSTLQTGEAGQLGTLTGLLDGVLGDLDGLLPLGLLDGLATPGISLEAAGVDSESEFTTAQADDPEPVAQPEEPTPADNLPRTGGGLIALAGLVLAAAGGTGLWLRRRMAA